DGEGLTGVLSAQAGAWFYKRNLGGGALAPVMRLASQPSVAAAGGLQLLDVAGDGKKALVTSGNSISGFQERTDDGWSRFTPFRQRPNVDFHDANLRMVDLDGDGVADLLVTEDEVL